MRELQIEYTSGVEFAAELGNVVVIGTADALRKRLDAKGKLRALFEENGFDLALLEHIGKQGNDGAGVISLPLRNAGKREGSPRFLTVGVLSSVCSRHNAPGRPDLVPSILEKSPDKSAVSNIVFAFDDPSTTFSAGVGVAKSFLMYNAKKQADSSADQLAGKKIAVHFDSPASQEHIDLLNGIYSSVRRAARLVDSPTCEVGIDAMIKEATHVCEHLKGLKHVKESKAEVSLNVIRGEKLNEQGFGGIYGVGKGAVDPPAFVHLSYKPSSKAVEKIALVGKGIVYDSGGLALKTAEGMFSMKTDMAGSAGILYAFNALVSTNFDSNAELHAILCLAENAIGPNSFRNGDILKVLSKKTVEINNTDAEGRLVLADGVYYASKNLQATTIIDMATLTGAQGIATGQRHAAIYCNDDEFENAAVHAGRVSGDLVHPLPYAPEFFREEFSSPIADMRNSVKNRMNASSACAGQFVGNHIDSDFKGRWLHIDMAYPATRSERSTGYGVALLTSLIHKSLRKIKLLV